MFNINGTVISITRGDSAYITLKINSGTGNAYTPQSGDIIRIQVRPGVNTDELLFAAKDLEIQGSDINWWIKPDDTRNADPYTEYYWDAQIELSNGDVFTFIPASRFKILDEVTI